MKIKENSTVEEVIIRYPEAVELFFKYGIPAIACGSPIWGTIGENAKRYNVSDLEGLLRELNDLVKEKGDLDVKLSFEGN